MKILEQVPLAPLTSLQLGGAARYLVEVRERSTVIESLQWAEPMQAAVFLLGGGTNVVVADAGFAGLVLHMQTRGVHFAVEGAAVLCTAQAGDNWDEVVAASVRHGLWGIECLSGIPGTVGAAPVQNIGAYGQDVAQTLRSVEVWDRDAQQPATLSAEQCDFAYRDSRFKRQPDRFVVLAVTFALTRSPRTCPPARHDELRRALVDVHGEPSPRHVRDAVLRLRRGKSMLLDTADENHRSVGSFFLNPIVDTAAFAQLCQRLQQNDVVAEPPHWVLADGRIKLAAAWLIERAGYHKGQRYGAFGISSRHALALVHYGGGRSEELLRFATTICNEVRKTCGIELVFEPKLMGV